MATRYVFRVDGSLPEAARDALVGMRITVLSHETIIDGEAMDDSHLHGIIMELRALGLTVVAVNPI